MSLFIHQSAIVDDGAIVGEGSRIWHFTHVSSGAVIGKDVSLGQNVFVAGSARIGNKCKIQNNVSVYDATIIEDEVFCGPSAVFTNVRNPRAAISRKDEYRETRISRGATLGANCTIVCGITVGNYAFVGAGTVVTNNVAPFALVVGVPARQIGWMSRFGERIPLPLDGTGEYLCPHTDDAYRLEGNCLSLAEKTP